MITKSIPLFLATFNCSYLQSLIVLRLGDVTISCSESTTSAFHHSTITIYLVVVAIFFYETSRDIFNHRLRVESINGGSFGLVSAYFGTVKTNGRGILHLHCLIWLTKMFSLFDLPRIIIDENRFKTQLLLFLNQVIRHELTFIVTNWVLPKIKPLISATNDAFVIALHFEDNINLVASQVQIHF